jgi:hypothetical protein
MEGKHLMAKTYFPGAESDPPTAPAAPPDQNIDLSKVEPTKKTPGCEPGRKETLNVTSN